MKRSPRKQAGEESNKEKHPAARALEAAASPDQEARLKPADVKVSGDHSALFISVPYFLLSCSYGRLYRGKFKAVSTEIMNLLTLLMTPLITSEKWVAMQLLNRPVEKLRNMMSSDEAPDFPGWLCILFLSKSMAYSLFTPWSCGGRI